MAKDYLKRVERVRVKMDFMKNTAGQRSDNCSDSNSPCLKKSCSVKFSQLHDMLNESERYQITASGLTIKLFAVNILLQWTIPQLDKLLNSKTILAQLERSY